METRYASSVAKISSTFKNDEQLDAVHDNRWSDAAGSPSNLPNNGASHSLDVEGSGSFCRLFLSFERFAAIFDLACAGRVVVLT